MLVCACFAPRLAPNLLYVRETTYCANANARGKIATGPLQISLITKDDMYHALLLIPLLLASLLQLFLFNGLPFFFFVPRLLLTLELSPHLIIDLSPAVVLCSLSQSDSPLRHYFHPHQQILPARYPPFHPFPPAAHLLRSWSVLPPAPSSAPCVFFASRCAVA